MEGVPEDTHWIAAAGSVSGGTIIRSESSCADTRKSESRGFRRADGRASQCTSYTPLAGGLLGAITGPVALYGVAGLENYLHGSTFSGLELVVAPFYGAVLGVLEGAGLGALWVFGMQPARQVTIGRLMLVVAILGLSVSLFVADPPVAEFVLFNSLLLLPALIFVLVVGPMVVAEIRDGMR
jgi:hypothetical protein